jgi:myo-inositol-1(or 4)-monophosphatase
VSELPTSKSGRTASDIARDAARRASAITLDRFHDLERGTPITKTVKSRGNYLTETDLAAETAILEVLRSEFPDFAVLSEETAATVENWDRGWLWVVDPIDGTSNFSRGIPAFAVNIALCHDGEPVLGLTHQPVTSAEFFATKGGGLFVNGERATVSAVTELSECLMGIGLGYDYERSKMLLTLLTEMWPGVMTIQNIGSAALGLGYVSSGRFDIYVHSLLYPWDMAAGIVQIREGGGLVLNRQGGPVTIYSEGIIAGAVKPVREFAEKTREMRWRSLLRPHGSVERDRFRDALHDHGADFFERDARYGARHLSGASLGDQHFTRRGEINDARRNVDVVADEIAAVADRRAEVYADPHPEREVAADRSLLERVLKGERGLNRVAGVAEEQEEPVAQVLHDAPPPADLRSQDLLVHRDELDRSLIALDSTELREAREVGEGDCALYRAYPGGGGGGHRGSTSTEPEMLLALISKSSPCSASLRTRPESVFARMCGFLPWSTLTVIRPEIDFTSTSPWPPTPTSTLPLIVLPLSSCATCDAMMWPLFVFARQHPPQSPTSMWPLMLRMSASPFVSPIVT